MPDLHSIAYDALAHKYDEALLRDQWIRKRLWGHYKHTFASGDHVLDFGCGTGIDTVFLAQCGIRVTAVDVSQGMIDILRKKIVGENLGECITAIQIQPADLSPFPEDTFDGMVSGFASVNGCENLSLFAAQIKRVVKPGATIFLHVLNSLKFWDGVLYIATGRWQFVREARRRKTRLLKMGSHEIVQHFFSDEEIRDAFGRTCKIEIEGMGFLLPESIVHRLPEFLQTVVGRVESMIGSLPVIARSSYFRLVRITLPGDSPLSGKTK